MVLSTSRAADVAFGNVNTSALIWEELEDGARSMFDVWVGQPELRWARLAWERLLERRWVTMEIQQKNAWLKFDFLLWLVFIMTFAIWLEEKERIPITKFGLNC